MIALCMLLTSWSLVEITRSDPITDLDPYFDASALKRPVAEIFLDGQDIVSRELDSAAELVRSTNASFVFQTTIDSISMGTILIREGDYVINWTVELKDYVSLTGTGWESTSLKMADGVNRAAFNTSTTSTVRRVEISNFALDGNKNFNTVGNLIEGRFYMVRIHDLFLVNGAENGLHIWDGGVDNYIYGNYIYGMGKSGIMLDGTDNRIYDSIIAHCGMGITVINAYSQGIDNVYMYAPGAYGINIRGDNARITINNCHIMMDPSFYGAGICITIWPPFQLENITITNNYIECLGSEMMGIWVTGEGWFCNSTVRGNRINVPDSTLPSMQLGSNTKSIIIEGNNFGDSPADMALDRTHIDDLIVNNIGTFLHSTQQSGLATIPEGESTIIVEHGLISTPSQVLVTPMSPPEHLTFWVTEIDDTTFTIQVGSEAASDLDFAWQASTKKQ